MADAQKTIDLIFNGVDKTGAATLSALKVEAALLTLFRLLSVLAGYISLYQRHFPFNGRQPVLSA